MTSREEPAVPATVQLPPPVFEPEVGEEPVPLGYIGTCWEHREDPVEGADQACPDCILYLAEDDYVGSVDARVDGFLTRYEQE